MHIHIRKPSVYYILISYKSWSMRYVKKASRPHTHHTNHSHTARKHQVIHPSKPAVAQGRGRGPCAHRRFYLLSGLAQRLRTPSTATTTTITSATLLPHILGSSPRATRPSRFCTKYIPSVASPPFSITTIDDGCHPPHARTARRPKRTPNGIGSAQFPNSDHTNRVFYEYQAENETKTLR